MKLRSLLRSGPVLSTLVVAMACSSAHAAEHVTLRNGSEFDCLRQEPAGDRTRLYLIPTAAARADSGDPGYIEVSAASVLRIDTIPDPPPPAAASLLSSRNAAEGTASSKPSIPFSPTEMRHMLDRAGAQHNIDADLLASIVHAESAGNPRAVSRAGARGLMQLMPSTASVLGVANSFAPEENIGGGTTYLDQLLIRYDPKNDAYGLELAVAAYNAGPAAVDRYHGIPPYAETRAYVARVVREFNRRKTAAIAAAAQRAKAVAANPALAAAATGLIAAN
jgi:hypothetical protein